MNHIDLYFLHETTTGFEIVREGTHESLGHIDLDDQNNVVKVCCVGEVIPYLQSLIDSI